MNKKWSDALEHFFPKEKEGEESLTSQVIELPFQNTLLLTPGALLKFLNYYYLIIFFFVFLFLLLRCKLHESKISWSF